MGIKEEMEKFEKNTSQVIMTINRLSGEAKIDLKGLSTGEIAFLIHTLVSQITENDAQYKALMFAILATNDDLGE